jgi:hypothetical protein
VKVNVNEIFGDWSFCGDALRRVHGPDGAGPYRGLSVGGWNCYDEQAGGVVDGAVAGAAIGGEVEDAGLGIIGGTGAVAPGGVAEGVDRGGGDGADGFEVGAEGEGC